MRKKQRYLLPGLVLALVMLALSAGFFGHETERAQASCVWQENTLEAKYVYGTEIDIPEHSVTVDGQTLATVAVTEYPDGTATRQTRVKLDQVGLYKVRYTATANGKAYVDEVTFTVSPLLAPVGEKSSVTYGKWVPNSAAEAALITKEGLMVRLAEGDKLTFSQIIDLSDATKNDTFLGVYATPDALGASDFDKLWITITDAVDPECVMRISVKATEETGSAGNIDSSYILAAAPGQLMTGYETWNNAIHVDKYGAQVKHSFIGNKKGSTNGLDTLCLDFRYDAQTKELYCKNTLVVDFDDTRFFTNTWSGFTSGLVRITLHGDLYNSDTANFCVYALRGVDLTEQKPEIEVIPPEISVDTDYETMPEAKVGGEYPVPAASAFDLHSGVCEVKTSVYYNYVSDNAVMLPVADGKFKTDRVGFYAIVYEATDSAGNTSREILWVHAGRAIEPLTVTADAQRVTESVMGEWVPYAACTVGGGSGNVRDYTTRITLRKGDTETDITDAGGFRPEAEGTYTVKYTVTDYVGSTQTYSYDVEIGRGNKPVFVEKPIVPKALISGSSYTVPAVYGYDYTSGSLVKKPATLEVQDVNGTKTYNAGDTYKPAVAQNGDIVTLTFRCENAALTIEVPGVIAFITQNNRPYLQLGNYFLPDGVAYTQNAESLTVTSTGGDGSWTFANAVVAENFSLVLRGLSGNAAFDGLTVTITDAEDETCTVEAYLENTAADSSKLIVGGGKLEFSSGFARGMQYSVGYRNGSVVCGTDTLPIKAYADGRAFAGFPSGRVYVSVAFAGVSGNAAYLVEQIDNQPISNTTRDRISPKIAVTGEYGGNRSVGETVVLPIAYASDVLDPNVTFTMTMVDPSGKAVTDDRGVLLENVDPCVEYTVTFGSYGTYSVRYTAKDTFYGTPATLSYSFIVKDDVNPEIVFRHGFATEAKVGDVLVIPDFTVSDNITATENIEVRKYVYTPGGKLIPLRATCNSVKATQAGIYEFRIMVYDEAGNVTFVKAAITVS